MLSSPRAEGGNTNPGQVSSPSHLIEMSHRVTLVTRHNITAYSSSPIQKGGKDWFWLRDHLFQFLDCAHKPPDPDSGLIFPQGLLPHPCFADFHSSQSHTLTSCTLTTAITPILHTPTVRSEAWSVSLSGLLLPSNVASSSHQPTVNESLSIDISWQRLNGLTAQRLQTKWTSAPVTNGKKMFRKWAAKGLRVFLIRCVLSLHFPMSAAYLLTYQVLVLDANAVPYWPPWVPCDWRTLSSAFWWEKK